MALTDLNIDGSYNIRNEYIIRTEEEWKGIFTDNNDVPKLGEIVIIGTKNDDDDGYTASKYIVGDGNTPFEELDKLDISTLHKGGGNGGGGKTDTVELAEPLYFSTAVGYINKGTTIEAGTTLNALL